MSELTDLITAVGVLTSVSTGSIMFFVEWRLRKLEECLAGHRIKHDTDIAAVNSRIDQHIDKRAD